MVKAGVAGEELMKFPERLKRHKYLQLDLHRLSLLTEVMYSTKFLVYNKLNIELFLSKSIINFGMFAVNWRGISVFKEV